jgi:hypothetical protein
MRIANVEIGKRQRYSSKPSHVPGVRMGNAPGGLQREPGFDRMPDGSVKTSARRSTGVNADRHEPIDPRSPRLTPA